jgi:hypothetical protein
MGILILGLVSSVRWFGLLFPRLSEILPWVSRLAFLELETSGVHVGHPEFCLWQFGSLMHTRNIASDIARDI